MAALQIQVYVSHSLNSLKGGYIGEEFGLWLICSESRQKDQKVESGHSVRYNHACPEQRHQQAIKHYPIARINEFAAWILGVLPYLGVRPCISDGTHTTRQVGHLELASRSLRR